MFDSSGKSSYTGDAETSEGRFVFSPSHDRSREQIALTVGLTSLPRLSNDGATVRAVCYGHQKRAGYPIYANGGYGS